MCIRDSLLPFMYQQEAYEFITYKDLLEAINSLDKERYELVILLSDKDVYKRQDLYDPSYQTANPMGDGFAAPDGFDWATTSNIKVTVEVNAPTNDEFYYVVELYDTNPIIASDARLLDKGVAKGNEPYTSEISIENTIKTLFVKEITPTGLATVRSAEITNGIANCNFKTTIPSVRSLAASTRSFTTITDPNPDRCV